jgi:RNA polymerase sigma factor (sigma-70 family)
MTPEKTAKYLRKYGVSYHDAMEIHQDAVVRALQRGETEVTIAAIRQQSIDFWRARRAQRRGGGRRPVLIEFPLADPRAESPEAQLARRDDHAKAKVVLSTFPKAHQEVLLMVAEGLTSSEIAARTGRTPVAIRLLVHRARKRAG